MAATENGHEGRKAANGLGASTDGRNAPTLRIDYNLAFIKAYLETKQ